MADGIIIDVGFKADIKNFINNIERDFKNANFDDVIGLSKSFENQEKEIRKNLKKLKEEIDRVMNGSKAGDYGDQLKSLKRSVEVLALGFKELAKASPDSANGMLPKLTELEAEIGQISVLCLNAGNAIDDLKKNTNGGIRFVDSSSKKELEETFKLLERARQESEKIGIVKKQHGNSPYEDDEDVLVDLKNTYVLYQDTLKEIKKINEDTSLTPDFKTKELDKLNASLVYSLTNIDRLIETYSTLNKNWKNVSIFSNSNIKLDKFRDILAGRLDDVLDYISRRKVDIQQAYSEMGLGDIQDIFLKGTKKDRLEIPIPLKISTKNNTLYNDALEVIRYAQEKLKASPLEIEVKLISESKSKKNRQVLNEIKENLVNIDNEDVKAKVFSLIDKMNRGIDAALLFNVNINTEKATASIKQFVEDTKEKLEDISSIKPEVILTQENKEAFQRQLDEAKGNFKVQIGIIDGNGEINEDPEKRELTYITSLKRRINKVTEAVEAKSLAYIESSEILKEVTAEECGYLNQLYADLLLIESEIKEICESFKLIPEEYKSLDGQLDFLNSLKDPEVLKAIEAAKESIYEAISDKTGSSIIIPEDKKQELIDQIKNLAMSVDDILFDTNGMDQWKSSFISSLDEIGQKFKTLFGNNPLNDMIEDWIYADNMIISKKGEEAARERSAVIGRDGKIYGSYLYDEHDSTRFAIPIAEEMEKNNIKPFVSIHSHASDKTVASSVPFYSNGKLFGADLASRYYQYYDHGIEQALTIALKDIELFDAKGFYESNNIDFADYKVKKKIADVSKIIEEEELYKLNKYFEGFVKTYGSNETGLKKNILSLLSTREQMFSYNSNLTGKLDEMFSEEDFLNAFFYETTTNSEESLDISLTNAVKKLISKVLHVNSLGELDNNEYIYANDLIGPILTRGNEIIESSFGLQDFSFTEYDDRDLYTYAYRQITPMILEKALEGTGYKNNYQDFMKIYSKEDFIKENPLGLSSNSISELFNNNPAKNFLDTLDKIVDSLTEIKNFSNEDSLSNAFNIKIPDDSLRSFIDEVNRLIEHLEKLPSQLSEALSGIKNFGNKIEVGSIDDQIRNLNLELDETSRKIKEIEDRINNKNKVENNFTSDSRRSHSKPSFEEENDAEDIPLYNEIIKILEHNKNESFAKVGLKEQSLLGNIDTGYSTRYRFGETGGTPRTIYKSMLDESNNKANTNLHSHPEELTSAFSFDDLREAAVHLKDGIEKELVLSMNDIAMLDISLLDENDLKLLSDILKEKVHHYYDNTGNYTIDEDEAYLYEINNNFKDYVLFFFDSVMSKLKKDGREVQFSITREELEDNLTTGVLSESDLKFNSEDDFRLFLKHFAYNLKGNSDIRDDVYDDVFEEIQRRTIAGFQESMFRESYNELLASNKLSTTLSFDDVYKKFTIGEFENFLRTNINNNTPEYSRDSYMNKRNISDSGYNEEDLKKELELLKQKQELLRNQIRLLESQKNLSNQGNVVAEEKTSLQVLEETFAEYKKFYANNDLESEAGAKAALAYYNAYKNALVSKLDEKDLKANTIGDTDKLFTGNYTDYKNEISGIDVSGINNEINKYREILNSINQPEVISIINSIREAIEKLLSSENVSDKAILLLQALNKTISTLGGKNGEKKLETLAKNLEKFHKSISQLDSVDSGFLEQLSVLLEKSEELKALNSITNGTNGGSNITKKDDTSIKEKIDAAKEFLTQEEHFLRNLVFDDVENRGETALSQFLSVTKDGLIQIITLVQEAEDKFKKFVYTTSDGTDLKLSKVIDDPAKLAKEVKQYQDYLKMKELAVPGAQGLGKQAVTFTPDSENWDKLVEKASDFGIKVNDIVKILRTVDRLGNESFQIFTKLSRITIGMDSNGVLYQKDTTFDRSSVSKTINDISSLANIFKSAFKGNDFNIEYFLDTLIRISDQYQELLNMKSLNIITDDEIGEVERYLLLLSNVIKKESVDKINKDKLMGNSKNDFNALKDNKILENIIKKIKIGDVVSNEDLNNLREYVKLAQKLNLELKNDDTTEAGIGTINKLRKKIAQTLNENTKHNPQMNAFRTDLEDLQNKAVIGISVKKTKEYGATLEGIKADIEEAGVGGLSIIDRVFGKIRDISSSFIAQYFSFQDIVRYIRTGLTTIKELDTAFTEMRKVSNESVDSLRKFQKESFTTASAVGTTAQQIQNSTADWMRLGESLEEAKKSAATSNILLNVSEFESIDEATESLVAMSSAYDELTKTQIVDKLNNVGNNFSISTDGLATALQKSASALKTAGNDMDEAIALVTAGE